MKSIVNNNNNARSFPKLMINKDCKAIVLMTSSTSGTIVSKGQSGFEVGDWSHELTASKYVDFDGSVTLSND